MRTNEKKFNVINIKILSPNIVDNNSYKKLLMDAYEQRRIVKLSKDKFGIIRQVFSDNENNLCYGVICIFMNNNNKALNKNDLEVIDFRIPDDIAINPKDYNFIFFPSLHRLAIQVPSVAPSTAIKIVKGIFDQVIPENCMLEVNIQQSKDIIERITSAKNVTSLKIKITPTNADIVPDAQKFIDEQLKGMNARVMDTSFKPLEGSSITIENNELAGALMKLAQSNGEIKASITNSENKKETIVTSDHPEVFKIHESTDLAKQAVELYHVLHNRFRGGKLNE